MSKPSDLRIDAGTIVTVDQDNTILSDTSIFISNGQITNIIATRDANNFDAEHVVNMTNAVIMPGLINAHGHAAMSLLRGIANDLPLDSWLQDHIWPAEAAWVNEQFVEEGVELAIAEMLLSGTTCFSDMYFFPEVTASVAENSGIRAQLCCPILDFPTAWGNGPDEYIDKTLALYDNYKDHELISVAFGPHAPYTVSDAPLQQVIEHAKKLSIPVQMHVHETESEVTAAIESTGQRPVSRLSELGLFDISAPVQTVHMTAIDSSDMDVMARSGTHVIHCPESNMKLASGFCPAQEFLDNGVNVALGTDGAASNNDLDMFSEMRTAALIAKGYTGNAEAIPARTALRMATINGAKALGMEKTIGSIEVGKQADIIAIDMNELNTQPSYDLEADLVYNLSSSQVTHAWVAGKLLVDSRRLTTLNKSEVIAKAKAWASRITQTA